MNPKTLQYLMGHSDIGVTHSIGQDYTGMYATDSGTDMRSEILSA